MKCLIILILAALTGCASPGYEQYLSAQQAVAVARSGADAARYNALASIAKTGDPAASVAAAMALAIGGNQAPQHIEAPRNELLQWAGILVPAVTQAYAIGKSADVAINASNNAYQTSSATSGAFVGMASRIQAPAANISTVSTDNSMAMSGTGVLGSGTYSTQANPVTTTTSTPVFAPVVVPSVVQITPVVVPDVIQIVPVVP